MAQQYRPLFKLDAGGMAEVYVAEAVSMAGFKKKVAIKRILPDLVKDERFVRMFLDEARLSLHFNHANVVSVFDIGKSDNTYFIVMEYVEGTTLKQLLEQTSRAGQALSVPLVLWIINEVLKGLEYAHRLGDPETGEPLDIVHRDISPPNILISWNGEVKLTDFGLAKATTQLESTDQGVVKGKFSYLSPEAAHGKAVDLRTDIFAVGILAWEMLSGRRLFLGETDWQTVELVRKAQVPRLSELRQDIPPSLDNVIARALAQDPEDRYERCNDFADDLLGILFQQGIKVGARELSAVLMPLRSEGRKKKADEASDKSGIDLITQLMMEELTAFRSIDEDSGDPMVETGAMPLGSLAGGALPEVDPGKSLIDELEPVGPPKASPAGTPSGATGGRGAPTMAYQAIAMSQVSTSSAPVPEEEPDAPAKKRASKSSKARVAQTRVPSPAPRAEGGGGGKWILILLLLSLAGAAAAYYLGYIPAELIPLDLPRAKS